MLCLFGGVGIVKDIGFLNGIVCVVRYRGFLPCQVSLRLFVIFCPCRWITVLTNNVNMIDPVWVCVTALVSCDTGVFLPCHRSFAVIRAFSKCLAPGWAPSLLAPNAHTDVSVHAFHSPLLSRSHYQPLSLSRSWIRFIDRVQSTAYTLYACISYCTQESSASELRHMLEGTRLGVLYYINSGVTPTLVWCLFYEALVLLPIRDCVWILPLHGLLSNCVRPVNASQDCTKR